MMVNRILHIACKAHARAGALALPRVDKTRYAQLAADMLTAYIDEKLPQDVLDRLIKAVGESRTHERIVQFIRSRVNEVQFEKNRSLSPEELRETVAKAVDDFRMPAHGSNGGPDAPMVKPYWSGDLQSVISGIHRIYLVNASYTDNSRSAIKGEYRIEDAYDFDNDRSQFPAYDNYRRMLAGLFIEDDKHPFELYSDCIVTYEKDILLAPSNGGDAVNGPLNKPLIFTAFMYAIEKGGCTKSLYWGANIPFDTPVMSFPVKQGATEEDVRQPSRSVHSLPDLPRRFFPPKIRTVLIQPNQPNSPSRTYIVVKGDTLSAIAKRNYGDANKWPLIYTANKSVIGSNPNLILPGQRLTIPSLP